MKLIDTAICAIIKNEARYVKDWYDFHSSLGVEHFFLYENYSTDDTLSIIKSFPNTTVMQIKGAGEEQLAAYKHCLMNYGEKCNWVAFIDCDEYIILRKEESLPLFLKDYNDYPALCVSWRLFGDSHHEFYEDKPVIERFTWCEKIPNRHVKSIIHPSRTSGVVNPHRFLHFGFAVDENKNSLGNNESKLMDEGSINKIQINHYVTKSKEECMEKIKHVRADNNLLRDINFYTRHNKNEIEDLRALELWNKLVKGQ